MSEQNFNQKLSVALRKKLTKKAVLEHFEDVSSEVDFQKLTAMVYEMLQLPKYDQIKRRLKSATGIVNFVTYNEYPPLVSMLLKLVYSPQNNDVYSMNQESLPNDFHVDAKGFLDPTSAAARGDAEANNWAQYKLDEVFFGTKKKMTSKWLKDNGLEWSDIVPEAEAAADGDDAAAMPEGGPQATAAIYERAMAGLELIKGKINAARLELERLKGDFVSREGLEVSDVRRKEIEDKMSVQRNKIKALRSAYQQQYWDIQKGGKGLDIPSGFGSHGREENGFLHFDPITDIREIGRNLLDEISKRRPKSTGSPEAEFKNRNRQWKINVASITNQFVQRLEQYNTTDPTILKLKDKFIAETRSGIQPSEIRDIRSKIKNESEADTAVENAELEERVSKIVNKVGIIGKLIWEIVERASQHGKVMIFDRIEDSPLCIRDNDQAIKLEDGGVLRRFYEANNASSSRSMKSGTGEKDQKFKRPVDRKMILISTAPIQGADMPPHITIHMNVAPVDDREAIIIVNHLLDIPERRAFEIARSALYGQIDKQYANDQQSRAKAQREVPQKLIEERSGKINDEIRDRMAKMIIGLSQRQAIDSIKGAVSEGTVTKMDDEGLMVQESLDPESTFESLGQYITTFREQNPIGLTARMPSVAFDNYIYRRGSKWGKKVKQVGSFNREGARLKGEITSYYTEIGKIDSQLMKAGISEDTRKQLLESREGYMNSIRNRRLQQSEILKNLPHYTILYGKAGTGKTVWADALADLYKFMVYGVDFGTQRNKWVGDTERNTRILLTTMFNSRDCVYLLDEVDRMMEMSHSGDAGTKSQEPHETTKNQVKYMLEYFEDHYSQLQENNIFIVMTTNNLEGIETPLLERSHGQVYEVFAPDRPEDYVRFISTFLDSEIKKNKYNPWFGGPEDLTVEQKWATSKKILNSIDLMKVGQAYAASGKQISFRNISSMFEEAFSLHRLWTITTNALKRGEPVELDGLPMTTDNLILASQRATDSTARNRDYNTGIMDVAAAKIEFLEAKMKEWGLASPLTGAKVKEKAPFLKTPIDISTIDPRIIELMEGSLPEVQQQIQQFDIIEEDTPEGKRRSVVPVEKPQQGFEEAPIGPEPKTSPQTQTPSQPTSQPTSQPKPLVQQPQTGVETPAEKKKKLQKQPDPNETTAKSSGEYLFSFLVQKGILTKEGQIAGGTEQNIEGNKTANPVNGVSTAQAPKALTEIEEVERDGAYFFGKGSNMHLMIAPKDENTPFQLFGQKNKGKL